MQSQPSLDSKILYLSFNQDYSCVNCGTTDGFIIFNVNNPKVRYHRNFGAGIGIVEILRTSNILVLVGGGDHPKYPVNKLVVWDDFKSRVVTDIQTNYKIVGVKFTEDCIAVVCPNVVKVYKLDNMKFLHKIETYNNPSGMCSLSSNSDNPFIVVPGKDIGSVSVLNYKTGAVNTINCHQNPITQISLNPDTTKFATASENGTLIRVFDIQTNTKFRELRRGSDSTKIYSINFSKDSKSLTVSSDRNTVHLYSLLKDVKNRRSGFKTLGGLVSNYFKSEWSLMEVDWKPKPMRPDQLPETYDTRHLACIPAIIREGDNNDVYKLYIVGYDGQFAMYRYELTDGGDKKMEKLQSGDVFELFENFAGAGSGGSGSEVE